MTDSQASDTNWQRVSEWRRNAMSDQWRFRTEFLSKAGWLAVPVETGLHFSEQDISALGAAAATQGVSSLHAVPLEELRRHTRGAAYPATATGFSQFNVEWGLFHSLLLASDRSFAVVCTTEYYFLLAGPEPNVRAAVGGDLQVARSEFRRYCVEDLAGGPDGPRGLELLERYAP